MALTITAVCHPLMPAMCK